MKITLSLNGAEARAVQSVLDVGLEEYEDALKAPSNAADDKRDWKREHRRAQRVLKRLTKYLGGA